MRKEMKNKNMEEANRLAEMEYQKGREAMGIPSEPVNEEEEATPDKEEALEETAEVVEGYAEADHGMGEEPGQEPVDEAKMEEELNEMKRITKKLLG
jgi:hypothetical protein